MGKVDALSRGLVDYGRKVRLGQVSLPPGGGGKRRTSAGNTRSRTVVKARYTSLRSKEGHLIKSAIQRVKTSASYYAHRPNERGERVYRAGFDGESDALTKHEVARMIEREGEKWERSYRFVLSPGEEMNQGEMREWSRGVMARMGYEPWQYVAFAHAGQDRHTEHDHVHVIAFTDDALTREQFRYMREVGDLEADDATRRELAAQLKAGLRGVLHLEREMGQGVVALPGEALRPLPGDEGGGGSGRKREQQMEADL